MSGGSMGYVHKNVRDAAEAFRQDTPLRRAFAKHLLLVAAALHDIEWVDSGDWSKGEEEDAIRACIDATKEMEQCRVEALQARDLLNQAIDRIIRRNKNET